MSIDGKRTYLNIFDPEETAGPSKAQVQPTKTQGVPIGTGYDLRLMSALLYVTLFRSFYLCSFFSIKNENIHVF